MFFWTKLSEIQLHIQLFSRFFGQHWYHATSILLIFRQKATVIKRVSQLSITQMCVPSLFHLILSPFLVARSHWLEDLAGRPSPELGQKMWLPRKTCFLSTDPLQMLQMDKWFKDGSVLGSWSLGFNAVQSKLNYLTSCVFVSLNILSFQMQLNQKSCWCTTVFDNWFKSCSIKSRRQLIHIQIWNLPANSIRWL